MQLHQFAFDGKLLVLVLVLLVLLVLLAGSAGAVPRSWLATIGPRIASLPRQNSPWGQFWRSEARLGVESCVSGSRLRQLAAVGRGLLLAALVEYLQCSTKTRSAQRSIHKEAITPATTSPVLLGFCFEGRGRKKNDI